MAALSSVYLFPFFFFRFSGDDNYSDHRCDFRQSEPLDAVAVSETDCCAKEDEAGAQRPPPCIRSAFVLFEVCTRAACRAVEAPTPRTQRQAQSLGRLCAHVCASWGRGVWSSLASHPWCWAESGGASACMFVVGLCVGGWECRMHEH